MNHSERRLRVRIEHLIEFLAAAHVGQQMEGPHEDRGGIMLVAEPGENKSTIINALGYYSNIRLLSDINSTEISNLRSEMVSGKYKTLAFFDMKKLYERHKASSSNVEGTIRALTGEGWQGLPHEAQVVTMPARTFVVGCMTTDLYKKRGVEWNNDGFSRRFLWIHYRLDNPEVKVEAANRWEKVPMGDIRIPWPTVKLPKNMTEQEAQWLRAALEEQPGSKEHDIQFLVLARAYQVLKHHYKNRRGKERETPMMIINTLAPLLTRKGGEMVLTPGPQLVASKRRMHAETA